MHEFIVILYKSLLVTKFVSAVLSLYLSVPIQIDLASRSEYQFIRITEDRATC